MMKKILGAVTLAAAALTSGHAFAHGAPVANHGGIVQAVGETWLELVVKGDQVELYLQDDGDDMPSAEVTGKVTLVTEAGRKEFALKPAGGNKLEAKAPGVAKVGKVLALLTMADKKTRVSTTFDIK
ncbi:hypothetical protein [Duganella sp. 1411]|uniref:hypothetical protein n=1 Tax=Duganella sp. 1411 TaxID=2806572 RepID=UPI001AE42DD1|nr:hypothetical protein [Duganella sp. 1411]